LHFITENIRMLLITVIIKAIFSLNHINRLVFLTEIVTLYFEVGTEHLYTPLVQFLLKEF